MMLARTRPVAMTRAASDSDSTFRKMTKSPVVKTLRNLEKTRTERLKNGVHRLKKIGTSIADSVKELDRDARHALLADVKDALDAAAKSIAYLQEERGPDVSSSSSDE